MKIFFDSSETRYIEFFIRLMISNMKPIFGKTKWRFQSGGQISFSEFQTTETIK